MSIVLHATIDKTCTSCALTSTQQLTSRKGDKHQGQAPGTGQRKKEIKKMCCARGHFLCLR